MSFPDRSMDWIKDTIKVCLDTSFIKFCRIAIAALDQRFKLFLEHLTDRLQQKWLRPAAASSYSGISESKLEKMRKAGTGPKFHILGDMVFYSVVDFDEYMKTLPSGPAANG